jgi:hypothetical protein
LPFFIINITPRYVKWRFPARQHAHFDSPLLECGLSLPRPKSRFRRRYVVDSRFNLRQHWRTCGVLGLLFAKAPSVGASMYTVIEGGGPFKRFVLQLVFVRCYSCMYCNARYYGYSFSRPTPALLGNRQRRIHPHCRSASLLHQPGISGPCVNESPSELLVSNVAVFDISKRNRKETMTGGADQFEELLGMLSFLQVVSYSRDDHDSRAIFLVATSACSGLRDTYTAPFNQ